MLLDTSGLLSFLDAADFRHTQATAKMNAAPIRLTHNYILAELVALANVRGLNRAVALQFVTAIADDPEIRMVWIGESDHRAAMNLLQGRPDKGYSLCDAVSFVIMRQHGLTDALTTDRHFEQEGFVKLLQS